MSKPVAANSPIVNDGAAETKNVTERIWTLDAAGLKPANWPGVATEATCAEKQDFSALFSIGGKDRAAKRAAHRRKKDAPILAILGFLPFQDEVDRELFANGHALAHVKAKAEAGDNPQADEQAIFEKYAYRLRYAPMSLRDYWDAFAEYLKDPSLAGGFKPTAPGAYRKLIERRRQLRSARIQCLQPYTGLHRIGASDADMMAGCQPIFFRFVEALLCEAGQGVASLVADPEFLRNSDMTGMRKHLAGAYNRIIVDHIVEGHVAAAGTAINTSNQSEAAIYCMLKASGSENSHCDVLYRTHPDDDGAWSLFESCTDVNDALAYRLLTPSAFNSYSFLPPRISRQYRAGISLFLIGAEPPISGMMEKRGGALVDINRERLEQRMRAYFDKDISWDNLKALGTGLTEKQSRFDPKATREIALATSEFNPGNIMPYSIKPFDNRWCYHSEIKSLWSDPKPQLAALHKPGNHFVVSRARKSIANEGMPFFFTSMIGDGDLFRGHTYYFPLWHRDDDGAMVPNLSTLVLEYLDTLGITPGIPLAEAARLVWNHVLAIGFSPAYLNENAAGLAQEWPRIPFPAARGGKSEMLAKARELFLKSSHLGEMVAKLLDLAVGVDGVTQGELRLDLAVMAIVWDTVNNAPFPAGALDAAPVTMEWGKLSKENAVLPAYGWIMSRPYSPDERLCLEDGARIGGVHAGAAYACLGDETREIRLSDQVGIRNIPTKVWDFTVGGYNVLQKWLSYRTHTILDYPLTIYEVESFCQIVRRIAALLLLGPQLNQSYAMIRDLQEAYDD